MVIEDTENATTLHKVVFQIESAKILMGAAMPLTRLLSPLPSVVPRLTAPLLVLALRATKTSGTRLLADTLTLAFSLVTCIPEATAHIASSLSSFQPP